MPLSLPSIVFLDRGTVSVPLRAPAFRHDWNNHETTAPDETIGRIQEATIVITNKVKLTGLELAYAKALKLIVVAATGYDVVDVPWCRDHGIAVSNVPGYTGTSVPEHVLMLILALRRKLIDYHTAIRYGRWQSAAHFAMLDYPIAGLSGSALGLIGYGALAKEVEKRAKAFGMRVLLAEHKGAKTVRAGRVAFEEVLKQSDVVSLHCPLTTETGGLIAAPELALMKPNAILINTARGGLVDEMALAEALWSGRLGGAGVDVLTQEPPRNGNPLLDPSIPNLIVTPHIAWTSQTALHTLAEEVILNIEAFMAGKPRYLLT